MTVVRDGIIRLRLEQTRAKLETPDTGPAVRQFNAETKAAEEATKATEEVSKANKEHSEVVKRTSEATRLNLEAAGRSVTEFGTSSVNAFRSAGEGAFRMARGLALLSASGSESLQKLIQKVAIAQGAFDVFAGGSRAISTLGAAFGPVGFAIGGITIALGLGAVAWQAWQADAEAAAEAAKKKIEEVRTALSEARMEARQGARVESAASAAQSIAAGARHTRAASGAELERRLRTERTGLQSRFAGLENADIEAAGEFIPSLRRPVRGTPAAQEKIRAGRRETLLQSGNQEAFDAVKKVAEERLAIEERLKAIAEQELQIRTQKIQSDLSEALQSGGGIGGTATPGVRGGLTAFEKDALRQDAEDELHKLEQKTTAVLDKTNTALTAIELYMIRLAGAADAR